MLSYESESSLLPPAQSLKDCIVGPSPEERVKGCPSWGPHSNEQSTKRRRTNNDNGESNHHSRTNQSNFFNAIQTFLSSGCCIVEVSDFTPKFSHIFQLWLNQKNS